MTAPDRPPDAGDEGGALELQRAIAGSADYVKLLKPCRPCARGVHSQCDGDMAGPWCLCQVCRRWLNAHGPFSEVPDR